MSVFPRIPAKLNPQFDCQALYNFEGNLNDTSGLAPAADLTEIGSGSSFSYARDHSGKQCLISRDFNKGLHSAVGISRLQITGDVTVQAVAYFAQFGVDSFGSQLFYFSGQQPDAFASENALWGVGIRADADRMVPNTFWESPPNTFLGTRDVDFTVDTGRWYHIVGVRDGVDASLYVNGALIAGPSTVATAPTGGTSSRVRVGEGNDGVQGLLKGTMISSLKVSDRVLTAREIQQEFNRVRSAV